MRWRSSRSRSRQSLQSRGQNQAASPRGFDPDQGTVNFGAVSTSNFIRPSGRFFGQRIVSYVVGITWFQSRSAFIPVLPNCFPEKLPCDISKLISPCSINVECFYGNDQTSPNSLPVVLWCQFTGRVHTTLFHSPFTTRSLFHFSRQNTCLLHKTHFSPYGASVWWGTANTEWSLTAQRKIRHIPWITDEQYNNIYII